MILTIILTFILSHSALADCHQQAELIIDKMTYTQKELEAVQALLTKDNHSTAPLSLIFKSDLRNESAVNKLITETALNLTPEQVSQIPELASLQECAENSKDFNQYVSLLIKLNTHKLEFLKKPLTERTILLENYENHLLNTQEIPKDLQASSALLTSITTSNEKSYLAFLDLIKEKNANLKNVAAEAKLITLNKNTEEMLKASNLLWRSLVDEIEGIFSQLNSTDFQELPQSLLHPDYLSLANSNEGIHSYFQTLNKAQARQAEIATSITYNIEELKKDIFIILTNIGGTRADLLRKCDDIPHLCKRERGISEENINDFLRELKIIPLKIEAGYAAKWFVMKRKSNMGLDGWLDLTYQLFILLILLLSPMVVSRLFDWITKKTLDLRSDIIAKSLMDYRQRTSFAVWIERGIPFLTPGAMFVMTFIANDLIELTDFPELTTFVFYLQTYYGYRLTRLLFNIVLEAVFSVDLHIQASKARVSILARFMSRLIFIEIAILHLIGDTARVALVYNFARNLIFFINIFFVLKKSYEWKKEITQSFSLRFAKIWAQLSRWENKAWFNILFPLLLVIAIGHEVITLIYSRLSQLDFAKKLLSEILKKKLQGSESAHKVNTTPSPAYLNYFDYYLPAQDDIFINREAAPIEKISQDISSWKSDQTNNDLTVIVGNRGMGKTTTLSRVYASFSSDSNASYLGKVPPKTLTPETLFNWLNELLGTQFTTTHDILTWDKELTKKTIIFVDDIQNLFLSTIGGFHAYEVFTEIIGYKTKNIFWCLTINSQSWAYLKGVYGKEHFYGSISLLTQWKDYEIQNLILTRHAQTGYERIYDKTVKAFGGNENFTQQVESQFFRLLWGQSRGNPRSALMYWLSAISEPRAKIIYVGVPSFVDSSLVGRMSDESHFLLASLARHESLTYEELILVTAVASTVIRKCLKEFEDKELTWTDKNGRIRISSKSQYVIDYFLMGKNFLYE